MDDVTLQQLHDGGLNPFAVELLVEGWRRRPGPAPVCFTFRGVAVALGHDVTALRARLDAAEQALGQCARALRKHLGAVDADDVAAADRLAAEALAAAEAVVGPPGG